VSPQTYLERVERGGIAADQLDVILRTHLIEPKSLREDDFERFLSERARLVLDRIERATGKPVAGRDSAEIVKLFGDSLVSKAEATETSNGVERLFASYEVLERLPSGGMSEGFKVRALDGSGCFFLKKVPVSGVPGTRCSTRHRPRTRGCASRRCRADRRERERSEDG
jgi:hypothetical protein